MKHSVNGKSFDEIFGQRGTKVQIKDLIKGKTYLNLDIDIDSDQWISVFDGMRDTYLSNVGTASCLCSNGDDSCVNIDGRKMGFCKDEIESFFEATLDQIALLNSYKNQNK